MADERTLITVWGNAAFGCEFARHVGASVNRPVLLLDADMISPGADIYFCTGKNAKSAGRTGFELLALMARSGNISETDILNFAVKPPDCPNLSVVTGNFDLENYEYYDHKTIAGIVANAIKVFRTVILLANRNIYDAFTLYGLNYSHMNIASPRAELCDIREYNSCISFLAQKQNIPEDKYRYVIFGYNKARDPDPRYMDEMTKGRLSGVISESPERSKAAMRGASYATKPDPANSSEYDSLLRKLEKQISFK